MTKDTTKEAAAAAEGLLFDDWFDAIEDGVRARVRGFIETMLEEELCEALSRPSYGRRKSGEDAAATAWINPSRPAALVAGCGQRRDGPGRGGQGGRHGSPDAARLGASVQRFGTGRAPREAQFDKRHI